jgi:hypothetical protein
MAMASSVGSAGAAVGSAGAAVGSTTGASVAVGSAFAPPHADNTKLIAMSTNTNERTNLVISIILLSFYTLKSYQGGFKDKRRIG